jgi:diadenosine tetraphosphate (Ap4A) HIT family hydrolase
MNTDSSANVESFQLDPRLDADTAFVCDAPLSRVLLMNDANYPWLILVPRRAELRELIDLSAEAQMRLWQEIARVSEVMRELFAPDKLNVAALGNVVAQLHVHVIARYEGDPAWPAPVWGRVPALAYASESREARAALGNW